MVKDKALKQKVVNRLEGKRITMRIGFTKTVYGEIEVSGITKEECKQKFDDGDWDDEYDNKSDYIYDKEPTYEY